MQKRCNWDGKGLGWIRGNGDGTDTSSASYPLPHDGFMVPPMDLWFAMLNLGLRVEHFHSLLPYSLYEKIYGVKYNFMGTFGSVCIFL